jgi:serine/threonine-protein kinase
LNFNSIPSSSVVLDGKPLGQTPVMGIRVSPGAHQVVFIHPELGRKPVQVDVDEGAKRTVSVRF